MKKLFLFLISLLAFNSFVFSQNTEGGKSRKKENKDIAQASPEGATPPTITPEEAAHAYEMWQETLPQLPAEWLQRLWDSCTLVDYTYFTMPITMSLDQQASIRSSLRHIGGGVAVRKADCKLFAKLFFQIKGHIVMDADLYFSDNGCSYFVYNIGGKARFSNPLSTEGVQFLNQIVAKQKAKGK